MSSITPASADGPDADEAAGEDRRATPTAMPRSTRWTTTTGSRENDLLGHRDVDDVGQKGVVELTEGVMGRGQVAQPGRGLGVGEDGGHRQLVVGGAGVRLHARRRLRCRSPPERTGGRRARPGPGRRRVRLGRPPPGRPGRRGRDRSGRSRCNARPPRPRGAASRRRTAPRRRPAGPSANQGRAEWRRHRR